MPDRALTIWRVKLPGWVPFAAAVALAVVTGASLLQSANTGDVDRWKVAASLLIIPLSSLSGRWAARPTGLVLACAVAPAVGALTGLSDSSLGWFVLVLLGGQVATTMAFASSAVAYAAMIATIGIGFVVTPDPGWVNWVLGTSLGYWGGWAARTRIEAIEIERAAMLASERQRLAHDLHDVVAHTLAVTVLHLGGARLAAEHEPAEAASAIAEAERLARESMAQLRDIVTILAHDGSGPAVAAPQPGACDILLLVDEYERAGLHLGASFSGDLARVPSTRGMVLYRIAQEALANAARHAPGQYVSINVEVLDRGGAHLTVRNPVTRRASSRPAGIGIGIAAMAERAHAVGGDLQAGDDNGFWTVDAQLPAANP